MNEYNARPFTLVSNKVCTFYEVSVNGKYLFQEFLKEVEKSSVDKKSIKAIFRYMDMFNPTTFFPKNIFRHIEGGKQSYWEFKKNNLRVYVIKQEPSVFILLGGYKNKQERDIKRIKKLFDDFQWR